jgi:uncharacterized protein YndB with AHSA1/START domain
MASVRITQTIDTDPQTLWTIFTDMPNYAEWLVVPSGKVTKSTFTRDAGVLTGSTRRIEVKGGRWFEEEFYEAAAPNFIAYRVVGDNTGTFARTYREMSISIRIVSVPGGGSVVTLGVDYTKSGFIARWTDFTGPGKWKRAFKRSLANLAELIARRPKIEVFTPPRAWRAEPAPLPSEAEEAAAEPVFTADEPLADAVATSAGPVWSDEAVEAPAETPAEVEAEAETEDVEAELTRLREMQKQMSEMGLSTDEIDQRIAALESRLANSG